jgi:uncharacterized phage-associated protein
LTGDASGTIVKALVEALEKTMTSVHDVAAYILRKQGPITAMKLQKLLYYCQAWSLVWDEKPLFRSRIEAWANGPVVPDVYARHRGKFKLTSWDGDATALSLTEKETVDAVLKFYGDKSSQWLSDLTHQEDPWKNARAGLNAGDRSSCLISHASMAEYYSSVQASQSAS